MFLPRLGGGGIRDGGASPIPDCLQVTDHDLKSERAAGSLAPSVGDYADTSPETGEENRHTQKFVPSIGRGRFCRQA